MLDTSPSAQVWYAAGRPNVDDLSPCSGYCATCGTAISEGVSVAKIETPSTADFSAYYRFGQHVCSACAWMYRLGKGRPGNYLVYGSQLEYLVISHDSKSEGKRPWLDALQGLDHVPGNTLISGVLTTDVKPRLWHKTQVATRSNFGLYVHAPDYDISTYLSFSFGMFLSLALFMCSVLELGYSKQAIFHGLLTRYDKAKGNLALVMELEKQLSPRRSMDYFVPALLVAGLTKKEQKTCQPPLI